MVASAAMHRLTVAVGDELELDEFKSREALDEWLTSPIGRDAAGRENLIKALRGG